MKAARFDGIVTRARLPETSRVHVRIHKSLAIGRLRRAIVAILVAMAVVAATAASVGAQWPTGCVELNDIVERHLGNVGNVGIYQRVFGDQAEDACQGDHLEDVRGVFAWAFSDLSPSPATDTVASSDIGGWPTTCVELNDIVERHLGNDHNLGIYHRTFAAQAEDGCQSDHRNDVRTVFAWAIPRSSPATVPYRRTSDVATQDVPTVREIAQRNTPLQRFLDQMPWLADYVLPRLADGISARDIRDLEELLHVTRVSRDVAEFIATTSWFAYGHNYNQFDKDNSTVQRLAIRLLLDISEQSHELLETVLTYTWLADDIVLYDEESLHRLSVLANQDRQLALALAESPWFSDGVKRHEFIALESLINLNKSKPELARQLLGYSSQPPYSATDLYLIVWIDRLFEDAPDQFDTLDIQRWFSDGLDLEERAFIHAVPRYQPVFDNFLQTHSRQVKTITLPLAGEVRLWAFQLEPFPAGEDVLRMLAEAVRGAEKFMRTPFPTNSITVKLRDWGGEKPPFRGLHVEDGIILYRYYYPRIERSVRSDRRIVYHETAHYYFSRLGPGYGDHHFSPSWLVEGGADFMTAYINDFVGFESLGERLHETSRTAQERCIDDGIGNIQQLTVPFDIDEDTSPYRPDIVRWTDCVYILGEYLLLSLYFAMGESGLSAAIQELYWLATNLHPRHNEQGIQLPTDLQVFQTFLRHTPPGREDAVREIYRRIHGGFTVDPSFTP